MVVAVSSLFLERVVDLTEARFYPGLPPPRPVPILEQVLAALRLLGISLLLNLLTLPLYLRPGWSTWSCRVLLNGYLVGREYFELVAQRRVAPGGAGAPRRRKARWIFWSGGAVIAMLLAVPILNLAAPVIGAAFMTHRLSRTRPRQPPSALGRGVEAGEAGPCSRFFWTLPIVFLGRASTNITRFGSLYLASRLASGARMSVSARRFRRPSARPRP